MFVADPTAPEFRARVRRLDLVVAVLLCAIGVSQPVLGWHDGGIGDVPSGHTAARVVLALCLSLPVGWRRQHPTAAVLTVAGAVVVQVLLVVPYVPFLAGLVPLVVAGYSTAAYAERARLAGLLAPAAAIAVVVARVPEERLTGEVLFSAFVVLGTWLAGDTVHARLGRARVEVATARQQLEEQEELLARARTEERSLIARELHDVIAHSVSVMGVQAGAARTLLRSDPDAAGAALLAVEETARTSVAELQRLLRLLRDPPTTSATSALVDDPSGRAPQPGLDDLPDLVRRTRAAGMSVELDDTVTTPVTAGLGLAVFRIVQEALTNALRHGGGAATVRVGGSTEVVEVEVRSPLAPGRADERSTGGHGVVGMRERAALYGGDLVAGPDGSGSFVVRARLLASSGQERAR